MGEGELQRALALVLWACGTVTRRSERRTGRTGRVRGVGSSDSTLTEAGVLGLVRVEAPNLEVLCKQHSARVDMQGGGFVSRFGRVDVRPAQYFGGAPQSGSTWRAPQSGGTFEGGTPSGGVGGCTRGLGFASRGGYVEESEVGADEALQAAAAVRPGGGPARHNARADQRSMLWAPGGVVPGSAAGPASP